VWLHWFKFQNERQKNHGKYKPLGIFRQYVEVINNTFGDIVIIFDTFTDTRCNTIINLERLLGYIWD